MNWQDYFMGFAQHAATKSKDSTKVGAVLVGPENEVLLTGYNGPPRGVLDLPERFERPAKYLYAAHAEQNLIATAARRGIRTDGCSVYVTHAPCADCAKSLIQAGIACVVVGPAEFGAPIRWAESTAAARNMLHEAGVRMREVEPTVTPSTHPRSDDPDLPSWLTEPAWIEWKGGENPALPMDTVVEVKFSDDSVAAAATVEFWWDKNPYANNWMWERDEPGASCIIAYRVVS